MSEVIHAMDPMPNPLVSLIARAASDPTIDMDKMERLLEMHERLVANEYRKEYAIAMSKTQSEMRMVSADATNTQTRSKYATYGKIDAALRPVYSANGFALSFNTESQANAEVLRVTCHVTHSGGHSEKFSIDMPADGKGPKGADVMTKTHATGAAATYGMRYLLKMIFNVAIGEDDNDGNGASRRPDAVQAETITVEQSAILKDLVERTGYDTNLLLARVETLSIDEIPSAKYEYALSALTKKLEKMDTAK